MRQNKRISFRVRHFYQCVETSELGLGSLKDRLCIIEWLIVSKLVSHLLAEYTRGLQSLADSLYLFPPPLSLSQLKSTEVLHPNYWRTCCSNSSQYLGTSNGKEGLLFFYVLRKTIFLGKVLSLCMVSAQRSLAVA